MTKEFDAAHLALREAQVLASVLSESILQAGVSRLVTSPSGTRC